MTSLPSYASLFDMSLIKRISDEQPVFPCWLYSTRTMDGKSWWWRCTSLKTFIFDISESGDGCPTTHWHPDQPEAPKEVPDESPTRKALNDAIRELEKVAPTDLPAPASEEAKDLGGEHETAKKVCAVLRGIVTIDENQQWDLLVGGVAQLRAVLFAHPTTDEAIAREAAHELAWMLFPVKADIATSSAYPAEQRRSCYVDLTTHEKEILPVILRALQRARSSQQKGTV